MNKKIGDTYCIVCKLPTGNRNVKVITKNGRKMMESICTKCGNKKVRFLPKQGGKGIADKFISALPVELHLLGTDEVSGKTKKMSFAGPGTKLNKRLGPGDVPHDWSKPINDLDRGAYDHDICYRDSTNASVRNACDDRLKGVAKRFLNKPGISKLDKVDAHIVTSAMNLIKRKV